jgi:glycosyltransferase involved in cell wall biosynthesis
MVKNPQRYLASADLVIASSYMSILEAAAIGKPIIAIANSELKEDYLEGHPLRKYIKVVKNAEELVRTIRGLYKGLALDFQGQALNDLKSARVWAMGQTAEKLADVYEELWSIRLA